MKSLFLIWLVILAATYPALSMLKDRIVNWSEYDSFFIAIKESKWKATWILLYNTYLVAGTVIFMAAVLPALVVYGVLSMFGAVGSVVADPVRVVNKCYI